MYMYDETGAPFNDAVSVNDNELITEYFPRAGTFHLQMILTADAGPVTGNPYTLTTTLTQ
jgi:hypothetical protein